MNNDQCPFCEAPVTTENFFSPRLKQHVCDDCLLLSVTYAYDVKEVSGG